MPLKPRFRTGACHYSPCSTDQRRARHSTVPYSKALPHLRHSFPMSHQTSIQVKIVFLISEAWNFFCFTHNILYSQKYVFFSSETTNKSRKDCVLFQVILKITSVVTNTVIFKLLISSPLFVCIGVCCIHGKFTFRSKQLMSSLCIQQLFHGIFTYLKT